MCTKEKNDIIDAVYVISVKIKKFEGNIQHMY